MFPYSYGTLNEGRSLNSGDTGGRSAPNGTKRCALNEGRSLNSGDTGGTRYTDRWQPAALNEGRSLNSGDTGGTWQGSPNVRLAQRRPESELRRHKAAPVRDRVMQRRSTKAGV